MKAHVRHIQGITFLAKGTSNHWVMLDGSKEFGGSEAASSPMEFMLFGLAGCTGSDIVSILEKKRVELEKFEMDVEAERAGDYPKVFTNIHLSFLFKGKGLKASHVEQAIELSRTKYCSAWAMLKETAEMTYSYEIQESE